MLLRAAVILCALAASLAVAGCGGGDNASDEDVTGLVRSSFKEVVVADLKKAGLEAEPGYDLKVTAAQGPNSVDLSLEDAFREYEADPEREDEIVNGLVDEAQQRLEAGIGDRSFEDVRGDLMPQLKGTFELRTYGLEPATTDFPGNLSVIYVVDSGDSFTVVQPEDLERWGTSVEEVHEIAIKNLERQTNKDEKLLCEPSGNQELCGWSTSDGYDGARMLVPGLRRQIVREYGGPAVYAVPIENVFVALPLELLEQGASGKLFRQKVQSDFQTSDDPLSPETYVERDGELVIWK